MLTDLGRSLWPQHSLPSCDLLSLEDLEQRLNNSPALNRCLLNCNWQILCKTPSSTAAGDASG